MLSIINLEAQLDRWPPGSPRRQAYNPTEWECLEHTYNLLPLGHELLDYKPGGHKQEEKTRANKLLQHVDQPSRNGKTVVVR